MLGRLCQRESALSLYDRRHDECRGACRGTAGLFVCLRLLACFAPLVLPGWAAAAPEPGSELVVEPARVDLIGRNARQQLAVTFRLADGTLRDVTRRCLFTALPGGVVRASASGVVFPEADGQGTVQVAFGDRAALIEVRVSRSRWLRPTALRTDVVPLFSKAGCNMGACHGNLNGKGGFRLSLRGEDPTFDFTSLTHEAGGRRLSVVAPEQSLVLLKPTALVPHEGGRRFDPQSVEAQTLCDWIKSGAVDDKRGAPRVRALEVFPAERILTPGAFEQQLVVTAELDDGTTRDVTRQASYDVSDPTRAEVSLDGLVKASRGCETAVSVRYMNGRGTARLAFLADRPDFVWRGLPANGPFDERVFAKLKAMRINPSGICSDSVFLRRAYLDAIGRLPEPDEARAFLAEQDLRKRAHLVDRLVLRPEFADFWALKWADLLRNEEKTMGEKGAWVLERWLRDQIACDAPLDAMVRRIVAGLGSTWQNPPASFYRTNRDPTTAAESVSQVFLGVRSAVRPLPQSSVRRLDAR